MLDTLEGKKKKSKLAGKGAKKPEEHLIDFKKTLCPWQDTYLRQFHSHHHVPKEVKDDLDESDCSSEEDNMKVVYNTLEL